MLRAFPLLLIVIILYNLIAFGGGVAGHHDIAGVLAHGVGIKMFSGDIWNVTLGDGFVSLGFVLLFIETVKATGDSARELLNHGLSMLVFVVALVELITLKGFSTSVFFFLLVMTLFDVVAGYTISIAAAKHDLSLNDAARR